MLSTAMNTNVCNILQLLLLGAYVFFGYVTRPPLASFKPSSVSEKYDDQSTVLKEKETKTVETEGIVILFVL